MKKHLKIFKALSDKTRMRIIKILEHKEMCVCEISKIIEFSMPTISNHLKILSEADLICSYKKDRFVNYFLNKQNKDNHKIFDILKIIDDEILEKDKLKIDQTNRFNL